MAASDYGRYYWWIKLTNGQELGVFADRVEIVGEGTLVLYGGSQSLGTKFVNMAVAPGEWQSVYAASAEDGRPLPVEHWQKRKGRD
ncbi:MAG TPA: hypothetical protein VF723_10540 [Pyrinomonadaceae bacterium]|jgi:hypothetical protein